MKIRKIRIRQAANSIEKLVLELGAGVRWRYAETGTIYLLIDADRLPDRLKIRVANHQDVYGTANYTCDGYQGTIAGAKRFILRKMGFSLTKLRRLRRMRRAKAIAETRKQAEEAANDLIENNPDLPKLLEWANMRVRVFSDVPEYKIVRDIIKEEINKRRKTQ